MDDLDQVIACPNCEARGWRRVGNNGYYECPVCETRGKLIIDSEKTLDLSKKKIPRGGKVVA